MTPFRVALRRHLGPQIGRRVALFGPVLLELDHLGGVERAEHLGRQRRRRKLGTEERLRGAWLLNARRAVEVDEPQSAVVREPHRVQHLDVTMHNTCLVQIGDRLGDLLEEGARAVQVRALLLENLQQTPVRRIHHDDVAANRDSRRKITRRDREAALARLDCGLDCGSVLEARQRLHDEPRVELGRRALRRARQRFPRACRRLAAPLRFILHKLQNDSARAFSAAAQEPLAPRDKDLLGHDIVPKREHAAADSHRRGRRLDLVPLEHIVVVRVGAVEDDLKVRASA
mmetsp:Transcript_13513/g.47284  ORF Transcript_13513/g.47284 Transcript_13513/m.47284 type:complete len:287 (-) Transcript_13513:472-1332(-)